MQQSNEISDSGYVDDATCKLIKKPQCAGIIPYNSFNENQSKHRIRRYAAFELKWPKTNLTWR